MNNLIAKIQLFKFQIINESFLKEDEKILKSTYHKNKESDGESIKNFNKKKDFKLT